MQEGTYSLMQLVKTMGVVERVKPRACRSSRL